MLNALNGFCTKLAEQLASPGVVLPWLLSSLGIPAGFSAWLVPLKNTGSLFPQLLMASRIKQAQKSHPFWVFAGITQGILLIALGLVLPYLPTRAVGWAVLITILLFSVASGVGSIAFKDVLAKTIPKSRRGRLLATRATGGGLLTLLVGSYFYWQGQQQEDLTTFTTLLVAAGALWIGAALLYSLTHEPKAKPQASQGLVSELRQGLYLLREDVPFRRFLAARILLMAIPLSHPFLVLFAKEQTGGKWQDLGLFVIIAGVSATLSSPFWGRFSDRSAKGLMGVVALLGMLILGYAVSFAYWPSDWKSTYTILPAFFLITMAHGGARLGRKTYLVNYAPAKARALYVAVANTTLGLFTLLSGLLSFFVTEGALQWILVWLMACLAGAAWLSFRLPKA